MVGCVTRYVTNLTVCRPGTMACSVPPPVFPGTCNLLGSARFPSMYMQNPACSVFGILGDCDQQVLRASNSRLCVIFLLFYFYRTFHGLYGSLLWCQMATWGHAIDLGAVRVFCIRNHEFGVQDHISLQGYRAGRPAVVNWKEEDTDRSLQGSTVIFFVTVERVKRVLKLRIHG